MTGETTQKYALETIWSGREYMMNINVNSNCSFQFFGYIADFVTPT